MSNTARPLMSQATGSNPVMQATNPSSEPVTNPSETLDVKGSPGQEATSGAQHDWEKRYKDLQSHHTRTLTELKAENARLRAEGTPQFTPPKTEEELARFKEENPETFAFIESIAHGIADRRIEAINGELTHLQEAQETSRKNAAEAEFLRLHPDYLEIDKAPEFGQWLNTKNATIQSWVINNADDYDSLSAALSMFKQETGWKATGSVTNDASQEQPSQSGAEHLKPGTQGGEPGGGDPRESINYTWSESEIAKLHPSEYAHYQEHIDLALREKRVAIGR